MNSIIKGVTLFVTLIGFILILSMLISLPVMWLWNSSLVPAIDSVNEISWLQAWGTSVLFGLLFKSSVNSNGKN